MHIWRGGGGELFWYFITRFTVMCRIFVQVGGWQYSEGKGSPWQKYASSNGIFLGGGRGIETSFQMGWGFSECEPLLRHFVVIICYRYFISSNHLFIFPGVDYFICSRCRYRRNLLTFQQNSALLNCWAIFTMAVTCLITTATLGLQPTWFTPSYLFWVHKLLYFIFVDIFHSLAIPLIMARTIPWERPKGETSEFYVRQPEVLEPRQSIPSQRKGEASWMKTSSTAMELPTLAFPENTAPTFLQNSREKETLEKILSLQKGCKCPPYCGKKTLENQKHFDGPQQKLDLLSLGWFSSNPITQGQRWKPETVFPKQAFRCRPPRATEQGLSPAEEELEIRKCTNEFGQNVLRYSRNHSTPVNLQIFEKFKTRTQ